MTKLSTILAGTAVAMFAQIAAAQAPMSQSQAVVPPNDPAYIDQSRLNYKEDPYVKARIARGQANAEYRAERKDCLLYTSPSPRDQRGSRMPSSA